MSSSDATSPPAPELTHLYTLHATIHSALYTAAVPSGTRIVYPIKGGTFSGPRLKGEVLDLGADWVVPALSLSLPLPLLPFPLTTFLSANAPAGPRRIEDRHLPRRYALRPPHVRRGAHLRPHERALAAGVCGGRAAFTRGV